MKKILITENQYKRLVKNLNEQYIIYNNIEDEKDVSNEILQTLYYLTAIFKENGVRKDVFVDKIEKGVVYLDKSKYTVQEIKIIEDAIEKYISFKINPKDKIVSNELAFNSGVDSDWVDNDTAKVDDDGDTAKVEDDGDTAKVEDDSDAVADECTITADEEVYFKNHIKNTSDGDGFRKWVNKDRNRLDYINKILSDCGLTDGLSPSGSINKHLKIAFKYKGKEWVSIGKPEIEVIESGDVVFLPPNKKGWVIRGSDCYGQGGYGASRGIRKHKGVDIKSDDGDKILSPMDGVISGLDYKIYSNKCSYLVGVDVTGTGNYNGYKIRLFYVKGSLPLNSVVKKGDIIGTQQSLHKNCYPNTLNGKYCMTNHVHVELIDNGVKKDPTLYNWGSGSNSKSPNKKIEDKEVKDKNTPSIEGNKGYILGKKITVDKNGPKNHESRKLGNWQSDNATDIFGTPGTTVYSITKGVVSKIAGNENDHKGKVYGGQITVKGVNGYTDIFYTHLQKIKVVKGQEVTLGTPLAEISLWETSPSGSHVHVGLPYGVKLDTLLDLSTGKIK